MEVIPYKKIIIIAAVIEVVLLMFTPEQFILYGPGMFWLIGVGLIMNQMIILKKLSASLKITIPGIYKKYSTDFFGFSILNKTAYQNEEVLTALNAEQKLLNEQKNNIFKYQIACFFMFGVSVVLTILLG